MKGNQTILDLLRRAAQNEIAAILAYTTHAAVQENWGLKKIAQITMGRAKEEMGHFDALMDRLIFLDGVPPQWQPDPFTIGAKVLEQIVIEAGMERAGIAMYNDFISQACMIGDDGSRALFEANLKDEERHLEYLEGQIFQAEAMSLENWISTLA